MPSPTQVGIVGENVSSNLWSELSVVGRPCISLAGKSPGNRSNLTREIGRSSRFQSTESTQRNSDGEEESSQYLGKVFGEAQFGFFQVTETQQPQPRSYPQKKLISL